MWVFSMSNNARHLFRGEEPVESRGKYVCGLDDMGCAKCCCIPDDVARAREQVFHQLRLVAELNGHMSLAKLGMAHTSKSEATLPGLCSNLWSCSLDVTVHGLAGRAFHDDVDGESLLMWFDQVLEVDMLADELVNLCDGEAIGDLV